MGRVADMVGKQFNYWTVLEETEHRTKDRCILYLCRCVCGTIREVSGVNLRRGKSKSCGCIRKIPIDLTGEIIDRLTVEKVYLNNSSKGQVIWQCRCVCGNICYRSTYDLRNKKHFHSCGCYTKEQIKTINPGLDLIGQTFNLLTVEELLPERDNNGYKQWKCRCQCGNITIVNTNNLVRGNVASCGCLTRSLGETYIEQILKFNNISYKREYTIKELNYKRFDFAIKDNNDNVIRLIEFDGKQHYDPNSIFNTSKGYSFEEIQTHDKEKNLWAKEHNIPLVRIPYWMRDKITLKMLLGDEYLVRED